VFQKASGDLLECRADHIKGPNVRSPLQEFFFLAAETRQDEKLFHSRGSLHLNGICPKTVLSDAPISVKPKARNQQVAAGVGRHVFGQESWSKNRRLC